MFYSLKSRHAALRRAKTFRLLPNLVLLGILAGLSRALIAAPLPPPTDIQAGARTFYETQGEWAGTFVIQNFLRSRIETRGEDHFIAHLEYQWAFKQDPSRSGTDERAFEFQFKAGKWEVINMGGNHSGRL